MTIGVNPDVDSDADLSNGRDISRGEQVVAAPETNNGPASVRAVSIGERHAQSRRATFHARDQSVSDKPTVSLTRVAP